MINPKMLFYYVGEPFLHLIREVKETEYGEAKISWKRGKKFKGVIFQTREWEAVREDVTRFGEFTFGVFHLITDHKMAIKARVKDDTGNVFEIHRKRNYYLKGRIIGTEYIIEQIETVE